MEKSDSKNQKWEAVIGLEIHAELKTNSKMFCGCANAQTQINADNNSNADERGWEPLEPNTNVCPICTGMPGTLPVLNRQAIEMTIKTGLALGCKIGHPLPRKSASELVSSALLTKWDRKNYFYPDLPKGYQISQYDLPIAGKGYLDINSNNKIQSSNQTQNSKFKTRRIGVTRIHLEEDTGTSKHPEGRAEVDYSLLDYNRSGVPLMELVTDPDIRSAKEAKEFCKAYQLILRTLGVADADMEKGQMRCEANISIREIADQRGLDADYRGQNISVSQRAGQCKSAPLGTKVEVKNLNSFKAVERAIEHEIKRQTEVLDTGEKIIQETRGWDDKKGQTYTMRVKETSADYRYFSEPDLPPVIIAESPKSKILNPKQIQNPKSQTNNIIYIDEIRKQLPEMPEEKIKRYIELAVNEYQASIIANNVEKSESFDKICKMLPPKLHSLAADWYVNIIKDKKINEILFADLLKMTDKGVINRGVAKDILPEVINGKSPEKIIKDKGLGQISDSGELETIIEKIIRDNPDAVAKIKSGQMGVMGFLVGQVMSVTKGQANPRLVNEILRKKITLNK